MLTFCPEIKGGNYIAMQRGKRREKKKIFFYSYKNFSLILEEKLPWLAPKFQSGFVSVVCSCLLDSQRKTGQKKLTWWGCCVWPEVRNVPPSFVSEIFLLLLLLLALHLPLY